MGIFTIVYQFADKNSTIMTFIPFLFYFPDGKVTRNSGGLQKKYVPEAITAAMIAANRFGETSLIFFLFREPYTAFCTPSE